jgi:glycosyltransferase involved in cell wall biosynthesis
MILHVSGKESMTHIGIDISRLGVSARTGTEHYTFELLAALAKIDRENPYSLYSNGRPAALPRLSSNMQLRSIPFRRLWTHLRLSGEMALRAPDVLFVPAHVLPPVRPKRSVVTIHDLGYEHFPEAHPLKQRLYLRLSTIWSSRVATRVIAISHATRKDLIERYAVPADKISVIHHGVNPRLARVEDPLQISDACSAYDIKAPYFLYIGTVQPRKNLVRLIEAYKQVVQQSGTQAPSLVIAGKRGWLSDGIERRVQELGLEQRVQFTGYVDDKHIPALLSGARAFVFPSLYEGFGMPVLEAMACGAPVLTSTSSSLPEVVGDAALSIDPSDTNAIARGLQELASNDALCADLRQRGLAHVKQFTWERCAQQTLDVLL